MFISILFLIALLCYIVPHIKHTLFRGENDLTRRYGDTKKNNNGGKVWALVTGGSSGIGKAVALRLAAQGINIVLVAQDDEILANAHTSLQTNYNRLEFRKIGVDLSSREMGEENMRLIAEQTNDLQITLVFNIAGYLFMDNFANSQVKDKLANIECNVASVVRITDHFYRKMVENGTPGAIAFAASSLAFCPSPYATIYAAGKAFVSAFAHSLAIEAKAHEIDILVVHPGAVNTPFYEKFPNLSIFRILRFIGQTPEGVADIIISGLGRSISLDSGLFAFIAKFSDKLFGPNKEYHPKTNENKKNL